MFCNLTKEDCAAIYHALGCIHAANSQARIGYDGELLAKGDGHLSGPSTTPWAKNASAFFKVRTMRIPVR
jgi:hypothetical protein